MNPAATSTEPIERGTVRVRDLRIETAGTDAAVLVDGVSLDVGAGEAVGIVGESGSGKSLTLRAVLGLLPSGVRRVGGEVAVGGRTAMVFQDPLTALDPLETVGAQIAAASRANQPDAGSGWGSRRSPRAIAAREHALELMRTVHLPDPEVRYDWYPHQLSGGQRQRVVIAIALATRPDVLLCDEPTTALDVTVQKQILALLDELRAQRGLTLVFVSHNLAVVSELCSRIVVMRLGRVVEFGETGQVVARPQHSYTRALLDAVLVVPSVAADGGAA